MKEHDALKHIKNVLPVVAEELQALPQVEQLSTVINFDPLSDNKIDPPI